MGMIFEGSEKKLEIVVREGVSLRSWPEERFLELVKAARTQVLSKIENEACRAYLLSESSLFIWDDRLTMITCGTTTLADAGLKMLEYLKPDDIDALFFERKNEYFPHLQKTDFFNDIKRLSERFSGKAYRLGNADEHHLFLFHSDKKYRPRKDDTTLEILMYDLQGKARQVFNQAGQTSESIRKATGIDRIMAGFQVDDYAFSPIGYSLNAIKGPRYYTIHVTPQKESPYVSFETNLASREEISQTLNAVLEVFKPRAFDVVYFDNKNEAEKITVGGFERRSSVREKLTCGFTVNYGHFSEPRTNVLKAELLEI